MEVKVLTLHNYINLHDNNCRFDSVVYSYATMLK